MKGLEPISRLLTAALPASGDRPAGHDVQRRLADFWRAELGGGVEVVGGAAVDAAAMDAATMPSSPLLFTSGRLVVFVQSAAHGHEIRHRAPSLLKALAQHGIHATHITVKTQPHSPPPTRATRQPFRLSPKTAEQIVQLAKTVDYPPLKESLVNLSKCAGQE